MEEICPFVAMPFRLGNSICDCHKPTLATHRDTKRLKLIMHTPGLLPDSDNEVHSIVETRRSASLDMISVAAEDAIVQEIEDDDCLSVEGDQILDDSSLCGEGEDLSSFESTSQIGPSSFGVNTNIIAKTLDSGESSIETSDRFAVTVRPKQRSAAHVPLERGTSGTVRSVFELAYLPLWGLTSVCGRRPEMEDAVATVPRLLNIPIQMLVGDRILDGFTKCLPHQTAHFFGVYDGHGGSQVADYCSHHMHSTLVEEIELVKKQQNDTRGQGSCQEQWKKYSPVVSLRLMMRLEANVILNLQFQRLLALLLLLLLFLHLTSLLPTVEIRGLFYIVGRNLWHCPWIINLTEKMSLQG